jgi:F-type H+-transporting ATPase subunit delta
MKSVSAKNLAHVLLESENLSMKDFVAFLAKNKMLKHANKIIEQYEILHNKKHNNLEVIVTVNERLSEHKQTEIRHALKEKYKVDTVHLTEKIDQRLIGGIKIQVGDTVYDSSIRNTLRQLETQLLK